MNFSFISTFKRTCQAAREMSRAINRQMDNIVQRWAIRLMCGTHIMALFITWAVPQSPTKNALIASLVLAGFAVPATWTAAAVRQKRRQHNGWRDNIKTLYFLWVPLAAFFAYWIGGVTAQAWYGGELNAAYYITSLAYAPFSFILQWKLAGQTNRREDAKQEAAVQRLSRIQRIMLHPIVGTFSVALAVMLLAFLITHGIVAYLPVLLRQEDSPHLNATVALSSLNSLVILCITVLCRLRRAIPEYREYMQANTRTKLEARVARAALIFTTSRATLNGTFIAAIIYGSSFATSQWLSSQGVAPALAVYSKESVSNLLWLLVPAINSREPISDESMRLALKRFVKRR
jgi:hypothetical protein